MAITVNANSRCIDLLLDAVTDFNFATDLIDAGLEKNAVEGIKVKKIMFIPQHGADCITVRDGVDGPIVYHIWDVAVAFPFDIDYGNVYEGGLLMTPYLPAAERDIQNPNTHIIFFI